MPLLKPLKSIRISLIQSFVWLLSTLSLISVFSLAVTQSEQNTFSYTISGSVQSFLDDQVVDVVSGGYLDIETSRNQIIAQSIVVILGQRDGEEALTEKLFIRIPLSLEGQLHRSRRAGATFMAKGSEYTVRNTGLISAISTPSFELLHLDGGIVAANFVFAFRSDLCISGSFSVALTDETKDLHLFVQPQGFEDLGQLPTGISKEEFLLWERRAYNKLYDIGKRQVEWGGLVWSGYDYNRASPLLGQQAPKTEEEPINCIF